MRLGIGVGRHHIDPQHHMRLVEERRGAELGTIELQRLGQLLRREMRGEGIGQAQRGGELGAIKARAQHPHRHLAALAGNGAHRLAGLRIAHIGDQFQHIPGEIIDVALQGPSQRQGGALVGARRAAHAQIDAAGKQRRQCSELFGDHQRAHGWAA